MTVFIQDADSKTVANLLAEVLIATQQGNHVQFLLPAGQGAAAVQRLRVTLSRSRKRNLKRGRKQKQFSLHHSIYPYLENGRHCDAVVMWTTQTASHRALELLDDIVKD